MHALNDAQTGGHPRVQFRCSRCGKNTVVKTHGVDSTQVLSPLPDFARSGGPGVSALLGANAQGFFLPANKVISLSVIAGPARGQAISLEKPLVVLGRSGADFTIGDPNISRQHCAVEVRGDAVRLRDLDSTNGTFVGLERVRAAELRHLSEFRMGLTVVLVTITPKLSSPF
jgi:pSer/pThr/pTyr-binding forkhead associated (FHA) protein